ncbi:WhiB family transcriptional regulator [Prescottella soli]
MTLADLLPATDDTIDWDVAACRGDRHPDHWFPDPSEPFDCAARVCARCPITTACGDYAAAIGQSGVWGGREYRRGRSARQLAQRLANRGVNPERRVHPARRVLVASACRLRTPIGSPDPGSGTADDERRQHLSARVTSRPTLYWVSGVVMGYYASDESGPQ